MKHLKKLCVLAALFLLPSSFFLCHAADYTVTATSVVASSSAKISRGVAGATITAGMTLYKDTADSNKLKACDANGTAIVAAFAGVALNGGSSGQPISYTAYDPSFTPGFSLLAGQVVVTSATAGLMAPAEDAASGDRVVVLGVGIGSNKMKLIPLASGVAKMTPTPTPTPAP